MAGKKTLDRSKQRNSNRGKKTRRLAPINGSYADHNEQFKQKR
jgi:hypothetical protein